MEIKNIDIKINNKVILKETNISLHSNEVIFEGGIPANSIYFKEIIEDDDILKISLSKINKETIKLILEENSISFNKLSNNNLFTFSFSNKEDCNNYFIELIKIIN